MSIKKAREAPPSQSRSFALNWTAKKDSCGALIRSRDQIRLFCGSEENSFTGVNRRNLPSDTSEDIIHVSAAIRSSHLFGTWMNPSVEGKHLSASEPQPRNAASFLSSQRHDASLALVQPSSSSSLAEPCEDGAPPHQKRCC